MKKLLLLLILFSAVGAHAQIVAAAADNYQLYYCGNQRVHQSDSVQLWAFLNTGTTKASSLQWNGPFGIPFTPVTTWQGSGLVSSYFWVSGLQPGSYVFTVTGKSATGLTSTDYDTLTVLPNPAPRMVISVTYKLVGGLWMPSFVYSDGSTQ